ncbi:hypothetical protein JSO19_09215 [Leucobacter sp. UCMA 4100]|uniref:Ig-like domain-containing protein n=1 Tax=Leucobacter sp. UCMA 4100 TaxID=2810534 RepID=UPI0022EA60B1|nr:Ig-like domain-containing protein [Leucobacter sp. UCMA 4100]MDA3147560.1 hypothetical protein [Leucobacter sp. UCMA 4100]
MRRRTWVAWVASVAAVAVAATLAVLWPGYDARQVPPDNASVWVLQTGDGKRYARVNSDLGELDTVKEVENPSQLVQHGDRAVLFAEGNQRLSTLDQAAPKDLTDVNTDDFEQAPAETIAVETAGEWIAYLTASGNVYVGTLGEQAMSVRLQRGPAAGGDAESGGAEREAFSALGVSPSGEVALVAETTGMLVTARASDGGVAREWKLPEPPNSSAQLAHVGGEWIVLDDETGKLWQEGKNEPIATDIESGSLLQYSAEGTSREIAIADSEGLTLIEVGGGNVSRLTEASGVPARPLSLDGTLYAAWVSEGSGSLYVSGDGLQELEFLGEKLPDDPSLSLMSNGSHVLLNEQSSGWVWSVPEGTLLPSSLQWRVDEQTPQVTESMKPERVLEPKPPVAEPDSFGVRAGESVLLPVLLNDHDPNEDVLTIVPSSVTQPDSAFGVVSAANNEQHLVLDVAADATGTASFTYAVTDGTTADGLNSAPATVTLKVIDDGVNEAPVWCGTEGCLAEWPTIDVAPGETQTVNVLDGWVDPEGDPLFLSGIKQESEYGQVVTAPDGTVTFRHPDPSDTEARSISLDVVVEDTRGATATKALVVQVSPNPEFTVTASAVTGGTGRPITIDLSDQVQGATGAAQIDAITPLTEATGQSIENRQGLQATFEAETAGSYLLQATVSDAIGEASGLVRVTVLDPADAPITTVPLTAFVRPGEDATVDVVEAVSDPLGSVILLDDLDVDPAAGSALTVNAVGQRHLRVTGDTENGEPGVLGRATYRASDATGQEGRSARGEITFVLLPSAESIAPIAADDRVTVRAGQQVDIPVLENDTAPAGAHMVLDPSALVNDQEAGLAFATPEVVRYLAPDEPGNYTLSYRVHLLGFPALTSTAKVHITVTGDESSTPPTAHMLEGRVLTGQQVTIPFTPQVTGGNGDVPVLDRVLTQPDLGTASLAPGGDGIVFSSTPGTSGQTQFTYRVKDSEGLTGVGTVRVGVLGEESDPSPVTYSDYAQVQAGPDNKVVLSPLDNDVDPSGTALSLKDVVPNATPDTAEYEQLLERIEKIDTDDGHVTLRGGETLGPLSYLYTVENERGDTATGMIVVKVVREQVPGYPQVLDTTLTSEDLADLDRGVDVMKGKVTWNEGRVADLDMQLWQPTDGFEAKGSRISGTVREKAQIVPFEVTGTTFDGEAVTTYAFLRVPGSDDHLLSVRSSYAQNDVNENESLSIDLAQAITVPAGERLELDESSVASSGARANAQCRPAGGLTVRYDAGKGNPWRDNCTVDVKLAGKDEYTRLSLNLRVLAADPMPELRAATITVNPGATEQYELTNMVEWNHDGDKPRVDLATAYRGDLFTVTQSGSTLTVRAKDNAQPSRQEPVIVSIAGAETDARLTLTVGRSPQTLPKGATVSAECSQSGGSTSCTVPVVGSPGEVNPLPGTPLTLEKVSQPAQCDGVTMSVANKTSVKVTWREDTGGAAGCRADFAVKDAQGRTSTGDRVGTLIFDLKGLPKAPSRLEWVGYTDSSVTLRPVSDRASIPEVASYEVTGAGKTVTCQAGRDCVVSGLTNGEQHEFTVKSVNGVGTSQGSAQTRAWAYRSPRAPEAVGDGWAPIPNGADGGRVRLSLTVSDRSTASVTIRGGDQPVTVPVQGSSVTVDYALGSNRPTDLTVTPETKFAVPPSSVGSGSSQGTVLPLRGVHGVGAPKFISEVESNSAQNTVTVRVTEVRNNGSRQTEFGYSIDGAACTPTAEGERSHTFSGVAAGKKHTVEVCAQHVFWGQRDFGVNRATHEVTLDIPAPAAASYTIGRTPAQNSDGSWVWPDATTTAEATPRYTLQFVSGSRTGSTLAQVLPEYGGRLEAPISVRNCTDGGSVCSPPTPLTATGATVSPRVVFDDVAGGDGVCRNSDLSGYVTVSGLQSGWRIETIEEQGNAFVRVSFPGLGLDPVESVRCQIAVDPPPEASPQTTATPEQDGMTERNGQ